mmetsp:Transcript_17723/g.52714  ORF Transcript_17723/g.52714 Transcript_17723/m.52714 type:complete len:275 (-) Transcript_17723:80-904(-)
MALGSKAVLVLALCANGSSEPTGQEQVTWLRHDCASPSPFGDTSMWGRDVRAASPACLQLRRSFLMTLRASHFSDCRQAGDAGACYLQIPKTASTTLKVALGLPINLGGNGSNGCSSVFTSVRDPIERFVSGMGTIWNRFDHDTRPHVLKDVLPDKLESQTFEAYAKAVIKAVRNARTCQAALALRHAIHLLPQQAFMDLACMRAPGLTPLPYVLASKNVDGIINATTCAVSPARHQTFHEGRADDFEPRLSLALLRDIYDLYAADAALARMAS